MMSIKVVTVILGFALAVLALPADLPDPADVVLQLGEEEFEDYLDHWLSIQEPKWSNSTSARLARNGCTFAVNGDLGQPQPVFLTNGNYLAASDNAGNINVPTGNYITVACTGSGRTIQHPNIVSSVAISTATCVSGNLVYGNWLSGNSAFGGLTCSAHAFHDSRYTGETCYNGNLVIETGFIVNDVLYPVYWSCFDPYRMEVLYVWYEQTIANTVHQTGVDRPSWLAGTFFPGVAVNTQYTQVQQKLAIAAIVGNDLADKYVTSTQFLSRGHLVAKSDMVFATGQRATFYFHNAAPQWNPFNGGNWNTLEQGLRARIGAAGYDTIIYTGTFGIVQLRDANDVPQDIYLVTDANNNKLIPVPLYYYKVVYDASRRLGTAFIGINNPHVTEAEAERMTFCTDRCRNNAEFSWLNWQPDRIDLGYSFCCNVEEFRAFIPHLPVFVTRGLLV